MEKINIKQQRDMGDLIQDTFLLLYHDARPLWYNIFLYVVPIFMLTGVLAGFWSYDLTQEMAKLGKDVQPDEIAPFFQRLSEKSSSFNSIGLILASVISSGLLISVVYNFVHQYAENEYVDSDELRSAGLNDSGWMIGFHAYSSFLLGLSILAFLLPAIYVAILTSMLGIVAVVERTTLQESFQRCRELLQGNWLQTFLLLCVIWVIQFILNTLFGGIARLLIIPLQGILGAKYFMVAETVLTSGISAIIGCVQYVMIALYYYSLIAKQRGNETNNHDLGRRI